MSALGQKRTFGSTVSMSALCQKRTLTSYLITSSVSACCGTVFGANEPQVADDFIAAALVRRMVDAVDHRHVGKIKRADAF
jgi:hypothetical protein